MKKLLITGLFFSLLTPSLYAYNSSTTGYAADDAHNHDGSHPKSSQNCGENYMFPGSIARLGSHSFLIIGNDGPKHLFLAHRSGTPPHNYQFILKVSVNSSEMQTYKKLLKTSVKSLPAVTTIYYDKSGKQKDRTFFCLHDLPKIFGSEQKTKDQYSKLFPIRASWQQNADYEGAFKIKQSVVPENPLIIERKDVEIIVYRYLPSYLEQKSFRKMLKLSKPEILAKLSHAPIRHDESVSIASKRSSYMKTDGLISKPKEFCPADYYLRGVTPPKTIHNFLLLASSEKNTVLAVHYYDQSPHNYQSFLKFKLSDKEMVFFKKHKKESNFPLLFQTKIANSSKASYFCMANIKKLSKSKSLNIVGSVYKNSNLREYKLGKLIGEINLNTKEIEVLVNRPLLSLMNPLVVANEILK